MSAKKPKTIDEIPLPPTAKKWFKHMAEKVAGGFEGEVTYKVTRGSGIAWVRWSHTENGDVLREDGSV